MNESQKYCRSLHAQISLGTTSDDRFMPDGYVKAFAEMPAGHVLTEKLDGQNNCFNKLGVFARSHTAPSAHAWDKPMWDRWELIKNDLGDLEIFGENMYGIHTIEYSKLESYFYTFAIREKDRWLSWEEVKFYSAMLDMPTVPEIEIKIKLKDFYKESVNENKLLQDWFIANLGMTWENSVKTPGRLGGFDWVKQVIASEGFVVRNADGYTTNGGTLPVKSNEFNNLFKLVREGHVGTDEHWTENWEASKLINYEKYKWYAYEFMNSKKKVIPIEGTWKVGTKVSLKGEYGVVTEEGHTIRWDTREEFDTEDWCGIAGTFEQMGGKIIDAGYKFKYINDDGTLKNKQNAS